MKATLTRLMPVKHFRVSGASCYPDNGDPCAPELGPRPPAPPAELGPRCLLVLPGSAPGAASAGSVLPPYEAFNAGTLRVTPGRRLRGVSDPCAVEAHEPCVKEFCEFTPIVSPHGPLVSSCIFSLKQKEQECQVFTDRPDSQKEDREDRKRNIISASQTQPWANRWKDFDAPTALMGHASSSKEEGL
ncbi:hypothetical protein NDU88_000076 [Pleurodeles waltl]|uniref:Uncharacterized protein n=1 Tax=Pleurodeles waltl TaxID=8319 RepID=A0AAV7U4C4_PLEWA|nr:hypothetical protein NDU88_000076 [Pleurodeles waltl]